MVRGEGGKLPGLMFVVRGKGGKLLGLPCVVRGKGRQATWTVVYGEG